MSNVFNWSEFFELRAINENGDGSGRDTGHNEFDKRLGKSKVLEGIFDKGPL